MTTKIGFIRWDVGANTSFSKEIYKTLQQSISYGMTSLQFCLGGMRSCRRAKISPGDIQKSKDICKKFPLNVFSHFPYKNLAGSVGQLAWDGDEEQDRKTEFLIEWVEYELGILSNFKINGVVIHPGNYPDRKKGLDAISKTINKIKFPKNSRLLLENAAGQGNVLATTFEELKDIYDRIDSEKQKHVEFCIDTAHIHGYGEYDLTKCSEVDRMFEEFDNILGIENFALLHLNDSEIPLGKKVDRHACLGTGYIWGNSFDSLIYLLDKCKKYKIPAVLETHSLDMLTLSALSDQK